MKEIKIIGIIPSHLDSVRYPKKIIKNIYNVPMIEHVRRRAKLSKNLIEVYVATNSEIISNIIKNNDGKVVITKKKHHNGTSRCSEAIKNIDCTHAIIIQGDEALLLPRHINKLTKKIFENPEIKVWNAVGDLKNKNELDKKTFVKCSIQSNNKINYIFRRSPAFSPFDSQKKYIKKILGILAFKKNTLIQYPRIKKSIVEKQEFIEQMSILHNNIDIYSVNMSPSLPSVNLKKEVNEIYDFIKNSKEQKKILKKIGITNYLKSL